MDFHVGDGDDADDIVSSALEERAAFPASKHRLRDKSISYFNLDPESNPLRVESTNNASNSSQPINLNFESLAETTLITSDQLNSLIHKLRTLDNNEERIRCLEQDKKSYLFTSLDLLKILDVTPSVKTRIFMIKLIGPRLTDPKSKANTILGLFRFAEEKRVVEEALKIRSKALENGKYSLQTVVNATPNIGVRRGRGGRGGRGLVSTNSRRISSRDLRDHREEVANILRHRNSLSTQSNNVDTVTISPPSVIGSETDSSSTPESRPPSLKSDLQPQSHAEPVHEQKTAQLLPSRVETESSTGGHGLSVQDMPPLPPIAEVTTTTSGKSPALYEPLKPATTPLVELLPVAPATSTSPSSRTINVLPINSAVTTAMPLKMQLPSRRDAIPPPVTVADVEQHKSPLPVSLKPPPRDVTPPSTRPFSGHYSPIAAIAVSSSPKQSKPSSRDSTPPSPSTKASFRANNLTPPPPLKMNVAAGKVPVSSFAATKVRASPIPLKSVSAMADPVRSAPGKMGDKGENFGSADTVTMVPDEPKLMDASPGGSGALRPSAVRPQGQRFTQTQIANVLPQPLISAHPPLMPKPIPTEAVALSSSITPASATSNNNRQFILGRCLLSAALLSSGLMPEGLVGRLETWELQAEQEVWNDVYDCDGGRDSGFGLWSESETDKTALPAFCPGGSSYVNAFRSDRSRGSWLKQRLRTPSLALRWNRHRSTVSVADTVSFDLSADGYTDGSKEDGAVTDGEDSLCPSPDAERMGRAAGFGYSTPTIASREVHVLDSDASYIGRTLAQTKSAPNVLPSPSTAAEERVKHSWLYESFSSDEESGGHIRGGNQSGNRRSVSFRASPPSHTSQIESGARPKSMGVSAYAGAGISRVQSTRKSMSAIQSSSSPVTTSRIGGSIGSAELADESGGSIHRTMSEGIVEGESAIGVPRRRSVTAVSDAKIVGSRIEELTERVKAISVSAVNKSVPKTAPKTDPIKRYDADTGSESLTGLAEASALGMDLSSFLEMEAEGAVGRNAEGLVLLSYRELVRRNFNKEYEGLRRTELEEHMTPAAFKELFGMSKESFRLLPQWRRNGKKRALMLF